jgi:hypothetical protein
MIHHDCAPWDGSAFSVQIPWQFGTVIEISIWESPEIHFPKTFSFPNNTGRIGNVILTHPVGLPESLSGTVSFSIVDQSNSVKGTFDLRGANGNRFFGKFDAEWSGLPALCG